MSHEFDPWCNACQDRHMGPCSFVRIPTKQPLPTGGERLTAREAVESVRGVITHPDDKQSFPTGAVRDQESGKAQLDLLPFPELERIARHLEKGAVKYGRLNFLKGIPSSRCLRSLLRHVWAIAEGKTDEDHASAAAFGLFCLMVNQRLHKDNGEINDHRMYDPDIDGDYDI